METTAARRVVVSHADVSDPVDSSSDMSMDPLEMAMSIEPQNLLVLSATVFGMGLLISVWLFSKIDAEQQGAYGRKRGKAV